MRRKRGGERTLKDKRKGKSHRDSEGKKEMEYLEKEKREKNGLVEGNRESTNVEEIYQEV